MAACVKVFSVSSLRTIHCCKISPAKDGPQRQALLGGLSTDLRPRRVGKSVLPLAPKLPPLKWDGTKSFQSLARFFGRRRRYFRCGSLGNGNRPRSRYTIEEVYQFCQQQLGPAEEICEAGDEVRAPFFDREGPMKTIIETLESNYTPNGAPARKDSKIVIVTGGSGSGKTTMLEELLRELLKLDAASSDAPLLGERIGKGAFFFLSAEFNGGGGRLTQGDMNLTSDQQIGVRLFASLLGLSVKELRSETNLSLEMEEVLEIASVMIKAAEVTHLEKSLRQGERVAGFVVLDDLNSAVSQARELITMKQGLGKALASQPAGELHVKNMVEAVAAFCTEEVGFTSQKLQPHQGGRRKSRRDSISAQLIVAGTGMPSLSLWPSPYIYKQVEMLVVGLNKQKRSLIVRSRVRLPADSTEQEAWDAFESTQEYRLLLQYVGGIPQVLKFLGSSVNRKNSQTKLLEYINGVISAGHLAMYFADQADKDVTDWVQAALDESRLGEGLGGVAGILKLVELTVTGLAVESSMEIGNGVNLARAQATGMVYTRPLDSFFEEPSSSGRVVLGRTQDTVGDKPAALGSKKGARNEEPSSVLEESLVVRPGRDRAAWSAALGGGSAAPLGKGTAPQDDRAGPREEPGAPEGETDVSRVNNGMPRESSGAPSEHQMCGAKCREPVVENGQHPGTTEQQWGQNGKRMGKRRAFRNGPVSWI